MAFRFNHGFGGSFTGAPSPFPGSIDTFAIVPGDTVMNMTWEAPDNEGDSPVIQYGLYMTPAGTGTDLIFAGWTPNLAEQFTGLENGMTYDFAVTAQNTEGEGPFSNIETGLPESATCEAEGDQLFDNSSFNCGTEHWTSDASYPATITDNGDGSIHLKGDTEYGSIIPDKKSHPDGSYMITVVAANIVGAGKISIRDTGGTWHSQTMVAGRSDYPYDGDIDTVNIGADNDTSFECDFEFVGLEATGATGDIVDMDGDEKPDTVIYSEGDVTVSVDEDSINIDTDGDNVADIILDR